VRFVAAGRLASCRLDLTGSQLEANQHMIRGIAGKRQDPGWNLSGLQLEANQHMIRGVAGKRQQSGIVNGVG